MCGRYTLARSQQELSERFGIEQTFIDFSPRHNICPTQKVPVILNLDGVRTLDAYRWGLIPSWVKDLQTVKPLINARCETLAEKPSFKNALSKRRCLIPADGFYEWKTIGKSKQPVFIHRVDRKIFAFAGIYEIWKGDDGAEPIKSFSIVTCEANNKMAAVHSRMPVILPPGQESSWLDSTLKSPDLLSLLRPCPDDTIAMYEVSAQVNSTKYDSADCIDEQKRLF